MHRVLRQVGDDKDPDELEHERQARDGVLELGRRRPAEEQRGRRHGEKHGHLDEKMAHAEVPEIGPPAGPEDGLRAQAAEKELQRHEDGGQEKQVEEEPVEADVIRARHGTRHRHLGATHHGGERGQPAPVSPRAFRRFSSTLRTPSTKATPSVHLTAARTRSMG